MADTDWSLIAAGLVAGLAVFFNLPTKLWLPVEKATLQYLAETRLHVLDGDDDKEIKAAELWKNNGAVIMVEAAELSSLQSELDARGIQLYAVVHETPDVRSFRRFFKNKIFWDKERRFYGPKERWMALSALPRPSVWKAYFRASGKGFPINNRGIPGGRLLGGVFVVGPRGQGILLEHRESELGDIVSASQVMEAVQLMKPAAKL